jgi:hypothetical protein
LIAVSVAMPGSPNRDPKFAQPPRSQDESARLQPALIRAKWLRNRLVKGLILAKQGRLLMAGPAI